MVARISIKNALTDNFLYNENKLAEGKASCLMAANYPKDLERLSQGQRFKTLQKVAELNPLIKVNSVHVSLNFDPSEILTDERLKSIASDYMERIGFGRQPFLVYRHFDAGHPHLHILSVKVGPDGKGLDTHLIGKRLSEPARKELEIRYNLVKAEDHAQQLRVNLKPIYAAKIQYGKTETRRAIANVLEHVLKEYKYTSLAELNAVLKLYNVMADRCRETSRVYRNNGLLYRILDERGQPLGVPIKASRFYQKPTLKYLEERFAINKARRTPLKDFIKTTVDRYFFNNASPSLQGLIAALKKVGIDTVVRISETGMTYGLTYIDHKNKAVFNGSDLGKSYSAKGILDRCDAGNRVDGHEQANKPLAQEQSNQPEFIPCGLADDKEHRSDASLLELLTQAEGGAAATPFELKKTRRKKKRRRL